MTDLTREQIEELLDSPLKDTKLAYSDEGYGVIYIAPTENEDSVVCVPVRDKNMGWHKANPEVYMALVDRFNAAPRLARQLLATLDALASAALDKLIAEAVAAERDRVTRIAASLFPGGYDNNRIKVEDRLSEIASKGDQT